MKSRTKLLIVIGLAGLCGPLHADMSAGEVTKARLEGKTYCGNGACTTFNKNGTISGTSGPWTATGSYEVKDTGTVCLRWNNPQWQSKCINYNDMKLR